MARRPRTYEWRDDAVECVEVRGGSIPRYAPQRARQKPKQLGIQEWLALFTVSSVLMVLAGLGLFAFCFVLFAVIFG